MISEGRSRHEIGHHHAVRPGPDRLRGWFTTVPRSTRCPATGDKVRVVEIVQRNGDGGQPARPMIRRRCPAAFRETAGAGRGLRGAGAIPEAPYDPRDKPAALEIRLPAPDRDAPPTVSASGTCCFWRHRAAAPLSISLTGLLAAGKLPAKATRCRKTVSSGSLRSGRVRVAGLTLEEAEAELFQRLVENQFDPHLQSGDRRVQLAQGLDRRRGRQPGRGAGHT